MLKIDEILKVILLSIVEGISEWLPISSTGHMILLDNFIKMPFTAEFREMFLVVIQLGAIMAVVALKWDKIFPLSFRKGEKIIKKDSLFLWLKIAAASVPALILGLLLNDIMDKYLYNPPTVSITLIIYGIAFIIVESRKEPARPKIRSSREIDYKTAFFIGLFQVLSLIPGTSRSGATILGGMLLGASRAAAADFTFYMAIPVMFGASLLKLVKFGFNYTTQEVQMMVIGLLFTFMISHFTISFLLKYIKKHNFKAFGWYRIALGILVLAVFYFTGQ
ncbi:MAG: undecaprenyl-diphosphate phosphatase [Oscillospiraceae bacterium]|jgi:undecaprenyl-diphosphatase|nr:undecaprenyl-diphosphate phosphatase [Oscillospiraceae bacterium]